MTPARFPHSDTPGSTLGCQLPRAYRRLLRPSSALDAKASTTCPSQLVTHHTPSTHRPTHRPTKQINQQINQGRPARDSHKETPPPANQTRDGQNNSHTSPPTHPTAAGKKQAQLQMLASTIQISNNNPTPPPSPQTPTHSTDSNTLHCRAAEQQSSRAARAAEPPERRRREPKPRHPSHSQNWRSGA